MSQMINYPNYTELLIGLSDLSESLDNHLGKYFLYL